MKRITRKRKLTRAEGRELQKVRVKIAKEFPGCAFKGAKGVQITCPKCLSDSPFHEL